MIGDFKAIVKKGMPGIPLLPKYNISGRRLLSNEK